MKVLGKFNLRGVISFIIGTFLMIILTVFVISSFMRFVVTDPNHYLEILGIKNSEEKIYDEIKGNLDYALVESNLSKELVKDIISKEEVKTSCDNQFENIIEYLRTGKNNLKPVDTEIYLRRFDEKLNVYIKDNSIKVDDSFNKDIKELRGALGQIIKNGIDIISTDIVMQSSTLGKTALFTSKFNGNIYYLNFVIIAVLCMTLLVIYIKDISRALIWISYSFMSAGFMFTLVFLSGLISEFYNNIIIYTPYLKEFISEVLRRDVVWLLTGGIVILGIGIIIYVICKVLNYRKVELEVR